MCSLCPRSLTAGLALLVAVIATIIASPVRSFAQNATTPGPTRIYSTIYSIGVEWDISGDPNHNASVAVDYRVGATSTWKQALPLVRVDYNGRNMLAGSILFLSPNTTYDVQLRLYDPDGGAETRTVTVATRPVPALPTGGRTFDVVPGAGGGDGSAGNPFRGIAAAQAIAQPGDVFLLHAGNYGGIVTFNKGGTSGGNYIVWKGAGDGDVTMYGIVVGASYVWLEGITSRDQSAWYGGSGILAQGPTNGVITRCKLVNNFWNIHLLEPSRDWYIADNTINGGVDPASQSLNGEGIEMHNTGGHTIAYNDITWTADGMSAPGPNTDIFGNDIHDVADDGIEGDADVFNANVRMWGNRLHNIGHNGISFQPQQGEPWYIIKNQIVSFREAVFKFRFDPTRFVALHNTFVSWGSMFAYGYDYFFLGGIAKNNLYVSAAGGRIWDFGGSTKDWRTDLDYEGFDWGGASVPFTYGGLSFGNVPLFSAASDLERKGLQINKTTCFETFNVPGPPPTSVPPQFMTLKSACNAVDAGTILPNINDDFVGAAPDLGAYEYGRPLPIYGPRPGNTDPPPPPAPALNVYRAGTLITPDGNLDEWSGADSATFSGTSSTATASLLWDDTNLYVAFQVTDTQLNAIATVRDDSNLWRDDAIEVYLDTKNDRATTMQADDYQFLVNLNNVQADLRGTGGGKDPTWNASWQSAVRLQGTLNSNGDSDGGYTLELVIPWAQIGVTPMTGMSFGLELVVDNSNPASATFEHFDWAGITSTGGPYAQPHLWNQVQLVDALPGVIDVTAPESSGVTVSSITSSGATISWTTNEPSDTQVDYGRTIAYGSVTPLNSELVTAHNRTLSGLAAGTLYHYRVKSRDAAGNLATSGDFTFRTHKRNR